MKNRTISLVVALGTVLAGASAQHVKVFDGQTGAHGAGGGGGGGKVTVHDISIAPLGNTILAFPSTFQGGVRVAAGDLDGDAQGRLVKIAASGPKAGGSFVITFDRPIDPAAGEAARLHSSNNLKQLGLGAHNLAELRIGFLVADGPGKMKEWKTFKATDVTLKRGVMNAPANSAQKSRVTSLTVTFSGLETSAAIGSANGGVWKTTNFLDPNTGETRIGLLLPAVQKVR